MKSISFSLDAPISRFLKNGTRQMEFLQPALPQLVKNMTKFMHPYAKKVTKFMHPSAKTREMTMLTSRTSG
jgi:hypothetical protein